MKKSFILLYAFGEIV